ncbi:TetR/AcrR family transcriptional regulator [Gordonia sp. ABSL11-1]|uniref:TetR/AcrR family transcriptional regulator n=1 Tax=Gordonia sp. ABSL11-1 TaxID=3053924 RepID=UPI0025724AB6|nr:TetR/AcrR family transcriptional regulator [Gordonia sp. ABSL11-1]MDL9944735.1 TetR/AcrR family transcriptional regulator [Gordonia sp. ABSL11-1]
MPDTSSRRGSRLTVDDWLEAAMQVLVSEGVGGIKISRLCDRLGVTKGSFYWHFTDIAALMSALAEHCRRVEESARRTLADLASRPPAERIEAMVVLVSDPRRWTVESAVRKWAETDESIAATVAALDEQVFAVALAAMRDLGFDELEAHARATTLLYAGIGYLHSARGPANESDKRLFIDLLTRR